MTTLSQLYEQLNELEMKAETSLDDDLSDIERDIEATKDLIAEEERKI
jgi:hypothetical protein